MHKVLVAVNTSVLRNDFVAGFNLDRIVVVLQCKGDRVKKTVVGLGYPLSDKVVREMAIVAHRYVTVAALLPRVEVFLHGVTVDAGFRVVAQVACSFTVTERECPRADKDAN